MKLLEYLQSQTGYPFNRIVCKDGESISVQAGRYTYCFPRLDRADWTHVEVGYPSCEPPSTFDPFRETPGTLQTVWGYVPIGLVEDFIERHGGFSTLV